MLLQSAHLNRSLLCCSNCQTGEAVGNHGAGRNARKTLQ